MAFSIDLGHKLNRIKMRRNFFIIAAIVSATSAATAFCYVPASLLIYKIKEPYFKRPVNTGSDKIVIRHDARGSGEFGSKRRNGHFHAGIDILVPVGAPVYAAKSGIAFRGEVPTGYGKYIMIYHPDGCQTYYGHLSDWAVKSAKYVRQGELIAYVGKSGNASYRAIRPHLHFEIRKNGEPQDPKGMIK